MRRAVAPRHLVDADHLQALRDQGVVRTEGAVDAGVTGLAAPVFHGKQLLGSMSVLVASDAPTPVATRIADQLRRAALRVQGRLDGDREG